MSKFNCSHVRWQLRNELFQVVKIQEYRRVEREKRSRLVKEWAPYVDSSQIYGRLKMAANSLLSRWLEGTKSARISPNTPRIGSVGDYVGFQPRQIGWWPRKYEIQRVDKRDCRIYEKVQHRTALREAVVKFFGQMRVPCVRWSLGAYFRLKNVGSWGMPISNFANNP